MGKRFLRYCNAKAEKEEEKKMNEKRLYVDLHVVQTVPPSCINRDDTGSPKTAVYGGTTRARVSSQAWKRAMRQYFSQMFHEQNIGNRTKKVIEMVAEEIRLQATDEVNTEKKAAEALKNAGIKIKIKPERAMHFCLE